MSVAAFFSYSHKDEHYKNVLETHLSILRRQGFIEVWHDRKIAPGQNWEEEIDLNLENAKIILLLVSANFLASDYCYDTETIFALEQHNEGKCTVIPIIVKPCLWQQSPFKHLQALPKDGKPISTWRNKDLAWLNVAEGILQTVESRSKKNKEQSIKESTLNVDLKGVIELFGDQLYAGGFNDLSLSNLLEAFLLMFNKFYFSPLRIQKWGSKQRGFSKLSTFSIDAIKNVLENMVKAGKLKTTISKKGNKIYKIK